MGQGGRVLNTWTPWLPFTAMIETDSFQNCPISRSNMECSRKKTLCASDVASLAVFTPNRTSFALTFRFLDYTYTGYYNFNAPPCSPVTSRCCCASCVYKIPVSVRPFVRRVGCSRVSQCRHVLIELYGPSVWLCDWEPPETNPHYTRTNATLSLTVLL